jgi:signal transduction histidine kinase
MTTKVQSDYKALKEFSENASHEMQTPLTNAIGKLELLLNDGNLEEDQLNQVGSALNALRHLSKMGSSLGLLTKIENREFHNRELIDLSTHLEQSLQDFAELMALKGIELEQKIDPGVTVEMDPNLMRILINNLVSNAIRHNQEQGRIRTKLDHTGFIICNTGEPLKEEPETLFQRFKKDQPRPEGLGLGLAIVKKICDVNGFDISYSYELDEHRLEVKFNK